MLAKRRAPVGIEVALPPVVCPGVALIARLEARPAHEIPAYRDIRLCRSSSSVYDPTPAARTSPAGESKSIDRTDHAQTIKPLRRAMGKFLALSPRFAKSIETPRNYGCMHSHARNARAH